MSGVGGEIGVWGWRSGCLRDGDIGVWGWGRNWCLGVEKWVFGGREMLSGVEKWVSGRWRNGCLGWRNWCLGVEKWVSGGGAEEWVSTFAGEMGVSPFLICSQNLVIKVTNILIYSGHTFAFIHLFDNFLTPDINNIHPLIQKHTIRETPSECLVLKCNCTNLT